VGRERRVQHRPSGIQLASSEPCGKVVESSLEQMLPGAKHYGALFGSSAAMQRIYGMLERLERSLATVLVEGESGTGKELVAGVLHERSMVRSGPFVVVNCAALDRSLVRSELFGHARGAFTGAFESRAGAFEAADQGTLFLDEIGELPLEIQPVLLRALETCRVQRVGETTERQVKVRLLAATHRNLKDLVREGKFREDLYYRLSVVRLRLPPLRERRSDIPELVRRFASELNLPPLTDEATARFEECPWPGNVRQLRNAVASYAALGSLPEAADEDEDDLDRALRGSISLTMPYAELKEQIFDRFLRVYLELLLARTHHNQTEAARVSGIDRSYLNRLLRKLT
jgi:DNA-binding NtrC family response regulator